MFRILPKSIRNLKVRIQNTMKIAQPSKATLNPKTSQNKLENNL